MPFHDHSIMIAYINCITASHLGRVMPANRFRNYPVEDFYVSVINMPKGKPIPNTIFKNIAVV